MVVPATTLGTKMPRTKMDKCRKTAPTISVIISNRTSKVAKTSFWWTTLIIRARPAKTIWTIRSPRPKLNSCFYSNICSNNSIRWTSCSWCSNLANFTRVLTCKSFCRRRSLSSISRSTSSKTRRFLHLFLAYSWISKLVELQTSNKIILWTLPRRIKVSPIWVKMRKVLIPWGELTPRETTIRWTSLAASEVLWHLILKTPQEPKVEIRTPVSRYPIRIIGIAGLEASVWAADLRRMFSTVWSSRFKLNRGNQTSFSKTNRNP